MSKLSDTFRRRAKRLSDDTLTTSLHAAIDAGNMDALRDLLGESENAYATDGLNRSALIYAVEKKDMSAAELILTYDRSGIDATSENGTALMIAAASGDKEMADLLLRFGAHVDAADKDGTTPLLSAQFQKQHDMMAHLLAAGANANAKRINDENGLHLAGMQNDVVAMQLLLDHGAADGINQRKKVGKDTPLVKAVKARSHEAVDMLLAAGADPNIEDSQAFTALHAAAKNNDTRMIYILAVKGHADINKVSNPCAYTPLHTAVFEKQADAVDMLIRLGADPHQTDDQGRTPLVIAGWNGCLEAAKFLLESVEPETDDDTAAGNRAAALYDAIFYEHDTVAHYLLDSGKVDVNHCVRGSDFILNAAVRNGNAALVDKILDAGADTNALTAKGSHALMIAVAADAADMATRLLQHGANPNLPSDGDLPLMKAVDADKPNMLTLLLAHGANPLLQDQYNRNALDLARIRSRANLVPILQIATKDYEKEAAHHKKDKRFQGPSGG